MNLLNPAEFFVQKMSAFYVCCIISMYTLQARFYHGSKRYEPRSDGLGAVWFGSILFTL